MATIRRVHLLPFATLHAYAMGFLGLIAGILYSFGGLIIDTLVSIGWMTSTETPGLSYGTVLAFGALLGMPLIFAACGFIAGIVVGVVWNVIAPWISMKTDFS